MQKNITRLTAKRLQLSKQKGVPASDGYFKGLRLLNLCKNKNWLVLHILGFINYCRISPNTNFANPSTCESKRINCRMHLNTNTSPVWFYPKELKQQLTLLKYDDPPGYEILATLIIVTSLRSIFHNRLASSCSYFQFLETSIKIKFNFEEKVCNTTHLLFWISCLKFVPTS